MRKIWDSSKTAPTASLMAHADARSWPIGFSSTTRERFRHLHFQEGAAAVPLNEA